MVAGHYDVGARCLRGGQGAEHQGKQGIQVLQLCCIVSPHCLLHSWVQGGVVCSQGEGPASCGILHGGSDHKGGVGAREGHLQKPGLGGWLGAKEFNGIGCHPVVLIGGLRQGAGHLAVIARARATRGSAALHVCIVDLPEGEVPAAHLLKVGSAVGPIGVVGHSPSSIRLAVTAGPQGKAQLLGVKVPADGGPSCLCEVVLPRGHHSVPALAQEAVEGSVVEGKVI